MKQIIVNNEMIWVAEPKDMFLGSASVIVSNSTVSTNELFFNSPSIARKNHDGCWRCRYCEMINSVADLNCIHCNAPGDLR